VKRSGSIRRAARPVDHELLYRWKTLLSCLPSWLICLPCVVAMDHMFGTEPKETPPNQADNAPGPVLIWCRADLTSKRPFSGRIRV
jgi:hypothetical protein